MRVVITPEGALLDGADRFVVSPSHGVVRLEPVGCFTTEGEVVLRGDQIATVIDGRSSAAVVAPCDAWVMRMLVGDGERVTKGAAIAHLRAT